MIRRVSFCGLVVAFAAGIASAQPAGSFTLTGSLITPRQFHTATLLLTGKVLLAGGISAYGPNAPGLSSAELYDPSTGTFSTTGTMTVPRVSHTATLLPDGRVLIAGGYSGVAGGSFAGASATAELYDPSTGTFTSTGQMSTPRFWHSAALLKNGKVLIAGGYPFPPVSSAEVYDPTTGEFTPTGNMTTPRAQQIAVSLVDDGVLFRVNTNRAETGLGLTLSTARRQRKRPSGTGWRASDPIAGVRLAYLSPPSDSLQFSPRGQMFGFRERHPFEHIVCFPSGASV